MTALSEISSVPLPGHDIETIDGVKHDISGLEVYPGLGAPLRVDHVLHITYLSENVDAVKFEGEATLQQGFGERTVPHHMGRAVFAVPVWFLYSSRREGV